MMFCRKCGNQIYDDSDFCSKCGAKVKSEPEPQNSELWMYNNALNRMNTAKSVSDFAEVENIFETLGEYKDSAELLKKCREEKTPLIYDHAVDLMNSAQSGEDFQVAAVNFKAIGNYKDSDELLQKCEFNQKLWIYNDGYKKLNAARSLDDYQDALEIFSSVKGFEDSDELGKKCRDNIARITYDEALAEMDKAQTEEEFTAAAKKFRSIKGYKDADELADKCERYKIVCPNCGKALHSKTIKFCPYCSEPTDKKIPVRVKVQTNDTANLVTNTVAAVKTEAEVSSSIAENTHSESLSKKAEEKPQPVQAPPIYGNVQKVCNIISVAAIIIAFILDPLISGNMPKETFEDASKYNSVIIFSYFFYGTFFICEVISIICGLVIAYHQGKFSGMWKFFLIGIIITTIIAAMTDSWVQLFILFSIISVIYVSKKADWI